ncbi:hypothetical protein K7432_015472 [Basidiobolus ranarum]|uniref:Uncharacterized protein n=1 Tax=Basidiobolus ranarum TaxID=34480 RepID=A0ABR2WG43_9FUNG
MTRPMHPREESMVGGVYWIFRSSQGTHNTRVTCYFNDGNRLQKDYLNIKRSGEGQPASDQQNGPHLVTIIDGISGINKDGVLLQHALLNAKTFLAHAV